MGYSTFWIHFAQDDDHLLIRDVWRHYTSPSIPFPPFLPQPRRRRPPPLTRVVLPALAALSFKGVSDYLEDLVSQIDAPLHHKVDIVFFNQLIFDIPQLYQFIDRLGKFEMPTQAHIVFFEDSVLITLPDSESAWTGKRTRLAMEIPCGEPDWQMSSLAQICGPSFPLVYTLERLNILEKRGWPTILAR